MPKTNRQEQIMCWINSDLKQAIKAKKLQYAYVFGQGYEYISQKISFAAEISELKLGNEKLHGKIQEITQENVRIADVLAEKEQEIKELRAKLTQKGG